jgi:hypothetical protein
LIELFLLLPVFTFLAISSFDSVNIGLRRILPIYPFIFVYIGILFANTKELYLGFLSQRKLILVMSTLMAWYLFSSAKTYPDYLTYFNEIIGGPEQGIFYLDDSNIDFGQDLKRLKGVMDNRGIEKVTLFYKGQADPNYYGINFSNLTDKDIKSGPKPGYYAISAHYLIRLVQNPGWNELGDPITVIGNTIYIFLRTSPPLNPSGDR